MYVYVEHVISRTLRFKLQLITKIIYKLNIIITFITLTMIADPDIISIAEMGGACNLS